MNQATGYVFSFRCVALLYCRNKVKGVGCKVKGFPYAFNLTPSTLLNKIPNVQVSDTTEED